MFRGSAPGTSTRIEAMSLLKLYRNLNYVRVRSFIPTGAALSTHLRTSGFRIVAVQDSLLEHVLATLDPYLPVVYLDGVDEQLHVGLPERHRPGCCSERHAKIPGS